MLLLIAFLHHSFALDWNSDIIAASSEAQLAKKDPLSRYFGAKVKNESFFHSRESMQKRIGNFKDVDEKRLINHNYEAMTAWLKEYATNYSDITWLYSIGESVENRSLWVLVISKSPSIHRLGIPEFKYVGNMHGNEVLGREALLYFIAVLCENFGKNEYLTRMVETTRIHIMPSMNPDGYERSLEGDRVGYTGRGNAHDIDLNRNFPARFPSHKELTGGMMLEKETFLMMQWFRQYPFVLSANLHGGSLVANYPFDDSVSGQDQVYSPTKDDPLFVALAFSYARAHSSMWKTGRRCGLSVNGDTFSNGITNGAMWYHLAGGMQDWQYVNTNCFEITIEMGCYKFPPNIMLPQLWNEHKYSLFAFLEYANRGVKGFVINRDGYPIKGAVLSVEEGKEVTTTVYGEFWRILLPGMYKVTISHPKYLTKLINVTVGDKRATEVNITLEQQVCPTAYNGIHILGGGSIRIVIIGIDSLADFIIDSVANDSCISDDLYSNVLEYSTLHVIKSYSPSEHLPYLKTLEVDALIVFGKGVPKSLVFSPGMNSPEKFDQQSFDESLKIAFLNETNDCESNLKSWKVSSMIDAMGMIKTFQLGISMGCLEENKDFLSATTAAILQVIVSFFIHSKDEMRKFSVLPLASVNPKNQFVSSQKGIMPVVTTSTSIHRIEDLQCGTSLNFSFAKGVLLGTGLGPHTLIMAVEQRTEAIVLQFASNICTHTDPIFRDLLNTSTMIMVFGIANTQLNCHDYYSLFQFEALVEQVVTLFPLVDYAIILAAGGLKVRYVDSLGLGRAKILASVYSGQHPIIKSSATEICSRDSVTWSAVSALEWSNHLRRAPDALLVQVACCSQEAAFKNLYEENKISLNAVLSARTQGLSGRIKAHFGGVVKAPVSFKVDKFVYNTTVDGYYYFWMPPGVYNVTVLKAGYVPHHFSAQIFVSRQTVHDILLSEKFSFLTLFKASNLPVTTIVLIIISGVIYGLYHLCGIYALKNGKAWNDGFERLPLRDFNSDSSGEDEEDGGIYPKKAERSQKRTY